MPQNIILEIGLYNMNLQITRSCLWFGGQIWL